LLIDQSSASDAQIEACPPAAGMADPGAANARHYAQSNPAPKIAEAPLRHECWPGSADGQKKSPTTRVGEVCAIADRQRVV